MSPRKQAFFHEETGTESFHCPGENSALGIAYCSQIKSDPQDPRTHKKSSPSGNRKSGKLLICLVLFNFASCLALLPAAQFGLFTYEVVGDSVAITDYPEEPVGEVDIPAAIAGRPVTMIGDFAFENCRGLTNITIPSGVTTIGDRAFHNCNELTSITIPSSVISIGESAFRDCSGSTSINFTMPASVTRIGDWAFENCKRVPRIALPASLTSFGIGTFDGCRRLTCIGIPSGVTSISDTAFANCTDLTGITLPPGLTTIGDYAFEDCSALTRITIPSSVSSIGQGAFHDCSGLRGITIPRGVTRIERFAFSGCSSLMAAFFLGDAPDLGDRVFWNTDRNFRVYYLSRNENSGFASPTWEGYPATSLEEDPSPVATWLLTHGFPHDLGLDQDANGDGVSLLTAYALDLDPRRYLQSSLPMPVVDANTVSMTFYGGRLDITYSVETSEDVQTWVTEGVTISDPDWAGLRTASVARNSPHRFLRLVVAK